jgi:polo-like kinase 1
MSEKEKEKKNEFPSIILDPAHNIKYKKNAFLGKGAFGKCFQITEMKNGNVYAGKFVSKEVVKKQKMKERLVQEISIHRTLIHSHIVAFYRFFEDDNYVYIVLELCQKRSMSELLKRRKFITEPEVRYDLKQVLSAVQYLHENSIIHRDLKLGNLFINNEMKVKIGDFGLATQIESGERKKTIFAQCYRPIQSPAKLNTSDSGMFLVDFRKVQSTHNAALHTLHSTNPPIFTIRSL